MNPLTDDELEQLRDLLIRVRETKQAPGNQQSSVQGLIKWLGAGRREVRGVIAP